MPGLVTKTLGSGDYRWLLHTHGIRDAAFLFHGSIRTGFLPVSTNLPATAPNGFYFTAGV